MHGTQHGYLDVDAVQLSDFDRRESGVLGRGRDRHVAHRLVERLHRFDIADATTQLPALVQGHERPPLLTQSGRQRLRLRGSAGADVALQRTPGNLEQALLLPLGQVT